jgi:hypothetical protein
MLGRAGIFNSVFNHHRRYLLRAPSACAYKKLHLWGYTHLANNFQHAENQNMPKHLRDEGQEDSATPDAKCPKTEEPLPSDGLTITEDQKVAEASPSTARTDGKSTKRKGKDSKNAKKTGRRRRGTRNDEAAATTENPDQPKEPRLPKRLSALLIGFCGSGYRGMQMYVESTLGISSYKAKRQNADNLTIPRPLKVSYFKLWCGQVLYRKIMPTIQSK